MPSVWVKRDLDSMRCKMILETSNVFCRKQAEAAAWLPNKVYSPTPSSNLLREDNETGGLNVWSQNQ